VETILNAPETQDEGVWKYEHLRQFCMELNGLAVKLQVCSLNQKVVDSDFHPQSEILSPCGGFVML